MGSEDRAKKEELLYEQKDLSEDSAKLAGLGGCSSAPKAEQELYDAKTKIAGYDERYAMRAGKDNASDDPWAHRSAGMRCGTCMWFVEKKTAVFRTSQRVGRCRRHAPTMNGYPAVFTNDWCGDHKLDEEKA